MNQLLTTDAVASQDRLSYWTDMICNVYVQLGCDAVQQPDFRGAIRNHSLPNLDLSVVNSRAQQVRRTPGHISRSTDDYFLVSIQAIGTGVVRQDGRDALLRPGDFALYDSTRPYELLFDNDFEQIVLKLPGERLRNLIRGTQSLTATTVSGREGAGHLLIGMIRTLKDDIDALQPASAIAVADGVLNILVAGLQTLPQAVRSSPTQLTNYHLTRIKALIDARLADSDLCVSSIAAQLGLSAGHVHRLFKAEAIPASQYIWNRRLDACSRDLLDPRLAGQSVSAIAYNRGFSDAAHFSRAFREKFGCAPREWRTAKGAARAANGPL
jgi:AraC-like DNA-binding protein